MKPFTVLFFAFAVFVCGCGPSAPRGPDNVGAWVACQTMVESRLKSPSTADFPSDYRNAVSRDGNRFVVTSYVDAQNAFGGTVRTDYTCTVTYDPSDESWNLENLDM